MQHVSNSGIRAKVADSRLITILTRNPEMLLNQFIKHGEKYDESTLFNKQTTSIIKLAFSHDAAFIQMNCEKYRSCFRCY